MDEIIDCEDAGGFSFSTGVAFSGMTKGQLENDADSQAILTDALSRFYPTIEPEHVQITDIAHIDTANMAVLRARQLQTTSQVHVEFVVRSTLASLGVEGRDQTAYETAYAELVGKLAVFVMGGSYDATIQTVSAEKGVVVSVNPNTASLSVGVLIIDGDEVAVDDDDDNNSKNDDNGRPLGGGGVAAVVVAVVAVALGVTGGMVAWINRRKGVLKHGI